MVSLTCVQDPVLNGTSSTVLGRPSKGLMEQSNTNSRDFPSLSLSPNHTEFWTGDLLWFVCCGLFLLFFSSSFFGGGGGGGGVAGMACLFGCYVVTTFLKPTYRNK